MQELQAKMNSGLRNELNAKWGHVCLIYDNEDQREKIVSEYLSAGLRQGEQVNYFIDKGTDENIRTWLLSLGVELPPKDDSNTFRIAKTENVYCPSGRFDPAAMIEQLKRRFEVVENAGYTGTRSCGEMAWILKGIPGSERFLEYESLLNTLTGTFPHIGMCQYDARLFDGATLFKVLQVHPLMIAQGQIVQNPYYVHTDELPTYFK